MNQLSKSRLSSNNIDLKSILGSVVLVDSFNARVSDIIMITGEGIPSKYDTSQNVLSLDGFFDITLNNGNSSSEMQSEHISMYLKEIFPGSDDDYLVVSSIYIEDLRKTIHMAYMFYIKTLTGFSAEEESFLRGLKYKQVRTPHDYSKVEELESKKVLFRMKKKEEFSMRFNSHKGYDGDVDLF